MAKDDLQDLAERVAKLEAILLTGYNTPSALKGVADFGLNERAFADRYIKGKSPAIRFAMLVAYLAKGDVTHEVSYDEIKTTWSRMTSIIKNFNPKYTTAAKTAGYVDSPRTSIYVLSPGWEDIFNDGEEG